MPPTGYPMTVVNRARELYEAGWNCTEIARLLTRENGHAPHPTTIRKWADPDYAEVCRMRRQIGGVSGPNREKTWQRHLRRIRELRSLRISYRSIAALMSHDFGLDLTADRVEYLLKKNPETSTVERMLWPEGART